MSPPPFPHKHSCLTGPISRVARQPPQLGLSSGRFCSHPQGSSSENTTIRTMLDPEKETLSPPTTLQCPCLSFLPPLNPYDPCLLPVPGDKNRPIPPQLTVLCPPPAQILGPIPPKGSWGLVGERREPVLCQGQPALGSQRLSVWVGFTIPH